MKTPSGEPERGFPEGAGRERLPLRPFSFRGVSCKKTAFRCLSEPDLSCPADLPAPPSRELPGTLLARSGSLRRGLGGLTGKTAGLLARPFSPPFPRLKNLSPGRHKFLPLSQTMLTGPKGRTRPDFRSRNKVPSRLFKSREEPGFFPENHRGRFGQWKRELAGTEAPPRSSAWSTSAPTTWATAAAVWRASAWAATPPDAPTAKATATSNFAKTYPLSSPKRGANSNTSSAGPGNAGPC